MPAKGTTLVSPEARILRYFREEPIEKVKVMQGLIKETVASRPPTPTQTTVSVKVEGLKPKSHHKKAATAPKAGKTPKAGKGVPSKIPAQRPPAPPATQPAIGGGITTAAQAD